VPIFHAKAIRIAANSFRLPERKTPPERGKFILEGKIKMKCTNTNSGSRQF
jgi:hypothetical protein